MDDVLASKINDFFSQFKHQTYKKGEILIRADVNPPGIFYIKQGLVKKYAISKKGDELVVNMFKPISFFPMSWAINETPNAFFYEAVSDSDIWRAPKVEVITFLKENPDVMFDLLKRVYRGTDGMLLRMTYLMTGSAYSRLITEILISAKRFGKRDQSSKENNVEIHTNEMDLATHAGMTRETVSREMKILKEKDLVSFAKNTLTVLNLDALEEELQSS